MLCYCLLLLCCWQFDDRLRHYRHSTVLLSTHRKPSLKIAQTSKQSHPDRYLSAVHLAQHRRKKWEKHRLTHDLHRVDFYGLLSQLFCNCSGYIAVLVRPPRSTLSSLTRSELTPHLTHEHHAVTSNSDELRRGTWYAVTAKWIKIKEINMAKWIECCDVMWCLDSSFEDLTNCVSSEMSYCTCHL